MSDIINGNKFVFGDGGQMVNIQVNIGSLHDDCDYPIFYEDNNEWDNFNPMPRIIKLRDALRKELI